MSAALEKNPEAANLQDPALAGERICQGFVGRLKIAVRAGAMGNSTNEHHSDATGHACAAGVHQWSEICGRRISGRKNVNGSKV